MAVTWWPRCSASSSSFEPTKPVAPINAIFTMLSCGTHGGWAGCMDLSCRLPVEPQRTVSAMRAGSCPAVHWPSPIREALSLAKPNYSFEKRQREIAKKKQQEEKDARKREAREAAKAAQSDQKPSSGS
jgi:hypothetical protein